MDGLRDHQLRQALAAAPAPHAEQMLELLDTLSRPMTVREIERALRAAGISKTNAAAMAGALKGFGIVMVTTTPEETDQ